ncbi:Proteasome subunit [Dirofilaria immitis]
MFQGRGIQMLRSEYQSSLTHQKDENEFQMGHFDRFVNGYGEIMCSENGLRYIFGPESIDLGPCCDPCNENWMKILKNEDVLLFSRGYVLSTGNGFVRTAKQVIIPETYKNCSFLGVVLRERHPSSTEGATAAFFCPPFGIIKLHKFAFGYDSDISWPLIVGKRFWVTLDEQDKPSTRVWKVNGKADDIEFGLTNTQILIDIPKLHLWQWKKTFNQSGIFAITDFILKSAENKTSSKVMESKCRDNSNVSSSVEASFVCNIGKMVIMKSRGVMED